MKRRGKEQSTVASSGKSISELIEANSAFMNAWYAQSQEEQNAKAATIVSIIKAHRERSQSE
jgi:hypothetical protein